MESTLETPYREVAAASVVADPAGGFRVAADGQFLGVFEEYEQAQPTRARRSKDGARMVREPLDYIELHLPGQPVLRVPRGALVVDLAGLRFAPPEDDERC